MVTTATRTYRTASGHELVRRDRRRGSSACCRDSASRFFVPPTPAARLLGGLGSAEPIAYGGVLTAIGTYGGVIATAGSVLSDCNGVSGRCIGSATRGAISTRLGGSGSPAVSLISSAGSLGFDWFLFATGGE